MKINTAIRTVAIYTPPIVEPQWKTKVLLRKTECVAKEGGWRWPIHMLGGVFVGDTVGCWLSEQG